MTLGMRNIWISLAVFACILTPAAFFQDSEGAVWAFESLAFVAFFTMLHTLDDRQRRREQGSD